MGSCRMVRLIAQPLIIAMINLRMDQESKNNVKDQSRKPTPETKNVRRKTPIESIYFS